MKKLSIFLFVIVLNLVYDRKQLISGVTILIAILFSFSLLTFLPARVSSQINSLEMEGDSIADTLLIPVPEDSTFQFELEEDFTILPGGNLTLVVDFDAGKSINWQTQPYELTPNFRIFQSSNAGFVMGAVRDTSGAFVKLAAVQAVSSTDTMVALSADLDTTYSYCLVIPEGTYDISASADGYTISDTVYEGVVVNSDSVLDGYNFTLE